MLAPGDIRNTHFLHDKCEIGCYGLNGGSGPNLACDGCGAELATRIDDCDRWQEVRLDPAAVFAEELPDGPPEPFPWDASEPGRLWPVDDEPNWYWSAMLALCAARVLAGSGGLPILFPDGPVAPIHDLLATALEGSRHQQAVRRLADTPRADGLAVICDLVGPSRPLSGLIERLYAWCAGTETPFTNLRVIAVLPGHAGIQDAALPVDEVPLMPEVWAYLAADQTVRSLAGTHLRHISRAELYRDEPPAVPGRLTPDKFGFGRKVRTVLGEQPEADQPWLRELINELGGQHSKATPAP